MNYRKKALVIQAQQITDETIKGISEWSNSEIKLQPITGNLCLFIHTLEGVMIGAMGDWVIRGTRGEFYPVKDEIFKDIYEQVEGLLSLPEYFDEFSEALRKQVEEDNERWGDTWKERGLIWNGLPQELRFYDWFVEKYTDHIITDEPFPWLKVAGEAMIGYVREKYMGEK